MIYKTHNIRFFLINLGTSFVITTLTCFRLKMLEKIYYYMCILKQLKNIQNGVSPIDNDNNKIIEKHFYLNSLMNKSEA